jgi:hypothetical protein
VIYGAGAQDLRVVPVDQQGRPRVAASASYRIVDLRRAEDDAERVIVDTTPATIDTVSTTTTAAAGFQAQNARALALTSTLGVVVGRRYLLRAAVGGEELVTVAEVVTGGVVLESPIGGRFPSGSAFLGIEVTSGFPEAEANDEEQAEDGGGPYALDVIYTGVTPTRQRYIVWLDRNTFTVPATIADVVELDQTILAVAGQRMKVEVAISRAAKDLRRELQLAGIDASRYETGDVGRDFCTYRAAQLVLQHAAKEEVQKRAESYGQVAQQIVSTIIHGRPDGVASPRRSDDSQPAGTSREDRNLFRRG